MTDIVKTIHAIQSFDELVPYIKETLTRFFGQYRMNENVVSVLEVIGRDYQKELSLKDISKDLFINPVYLGQLIKRETNSTFAELLNKQRIKAAQQLLLSTSDSIEDICYAVGYSNVGYFYKVFRKLCGKSPKAYRKQVENYTIIFVSLYKKCYNINNNIRRFYHEKETDLSMGLANLVCPYFSYVSV